MNKLVNLTNKQRVILDRARKTYGNTAQILVSNEELCELAAVCAKYPRYDDQNKAKAELHDKAVDEVADVLIVLDHIINIFDLDEAEVLYRIEGKVSRLKGWLDKSTSMEQTTVDRDVPDAGQMVMEGFEPDPCSSCEGCGIISNLKPGGRCIECVMNGYKNYMKKGAFNETV